LVAPSCSTGDQVQSKYSSFEACEGCPKFSQETPQVYLQKMKAKYMQSSDVYLRAYILRDLFFKAGVFEDQMAFDVSEDYYQFLHELDDDDSFIVKKLVMNLLRRGHMKKAETHLAQHLQGRKVTEGITLDLALLRGNVIESLGDKASAKSFYASLIEDQGSFLEACLRLSEILSQDEESSKAIKVLQSCSVGKQKAELAEIDFKLGRYYLDINELEKSEKFFQLSYDAYPQNSKSLAALAVIYEETGKGKSYINIFKKHLKSYPDDYLILSRMMDFYITKEDFKSASKYLEIMSDLNSRETDLKFKLTYLYRETGEVNKAVETLKEIISLNSDKGKAYYFLADLYLQQKNEELAMSALRSIPTTSAFYADGTIKLANSLRLQALNQNTGPSRSIASVQPEGADDIYTDFIKERGHSDENPKLDFDLSLHEIVFFEKTGDFKRAANSLKKLKKNPLFEERHFFYLASLYEKAKNLKQADKVMEEVIADDPINAQAHNFLGYSLLERNEDLSKAKKHIEKAYEISPADGHIMDSMGWLRHQEKKYEEALKFLLQSNREVSGDSTVLLHLAKTYLKLGKKHEAKQCLDEALKVAPSDDIKLEVLKVISANYQKAS